MQRLINYQRFRMLIDCLYNAIVLFVCVCVCACVRVRALEGVCVALCACVNE